MLRNLAKGWYLCCLKHRRRNLKMKCEKQLLRDYSKQTYLICNFRQKRNSFLLNIYFEQGSCFDETNKKPGNYCT